MLQVELAQHDPRWLRDDNTACHMQSDKVRPTSAVGVDDGEEWSNQVYDQAVVPASQSRQNVLTAPATLVHITEVVNHTQTF